MKALAGYGEYVVALRVVRPAGGNLGEQTGTRVDAINHLARQFRGQSRDTMPLTMFYTEGLCLDLSHKGLMELKDYFSKNFRASSLSRRF